jgi:hypothetical protein
MSGKASGVVALVAACGQRRCCAPPAEGHASTDLGHASAVLAGKSECQRWCGPTCGWEALVQHSVCLVCCYPAQCGLEEGVAVPRGLNPSWLAPCTEIATNMLGVGTTLDPLLSCQIPLGPEMPPALGPPAHGVVIPCGYHDSMAVPFAWTAALRPRNGKGA